MYWDSYNTIKRLDDYLPVDVYIAGCMPRPEALLLVLNFIPSRIFFSSIKNKITL
jgi:NADH:ubiquinone oxidoreductase subunit B-like Fe-S oxidoreductase